MSKPILNNTSRPGPRDLFEQNKDGSLVRKAMTEGISLSRFLEEADPTEDHGSGERLDAFGRQLKVAEIRTGSDPLRGYYCDTMSAFDKEGARSLLHEWCNRRWREARYGEPINPRAGGKRASVQNRNVWISTDEGGPGGTFLPYSDYSGIKQNMITPILPLSRLVAMETGIDSASYRTAYMTDPSATDIRMVRVPELGEIPLSEVKGYAQSIDLYKYGRGFEMSYEAQRRTSIEKMAFWLARAAIQAEDDKIGTAIATIINGDGNANSATAVNLTTLDPTTTPNNLTLKAFLAFQDLFSNANRMDLLLAPSNVKLMFQLLNTGTANQSLYTLPWVGGFTDLNDVMGQNVMIGKLSTLAANTALGLDTSAALEHVFEIGSNIQETDRFIRRQSDIIVISEVEGFAVLDKNAAKVLNLAA